MFRGTSQPTRGVKQLCRNYPTGLISAASLATTTRRPPRHHLHATRARYPYNIVKGCWRSGGRLKEEALELPALSYKLRQFARRLHVATNGYLAPTAGALSSLVWCSLVRSWNTRGHWPHRAPGVLNTDLADVMHRACIECWGSRTKQLCVRERELSSCSFHARHIVYLCARTKILFESCKEALTAEKVKKNEFTVIQVYNVSGWVRAWIWVSLCVRVRERDGIISKQKSVWCGTTWCEE